MQLLLTSAGITTERLHGALRSMLRAPIDECRALCIPTAGYANRGGAQRAWNFISGNEPETPMCELGWAEVGVLELTALPSIDPEVWEPMVAETDVILVNGGDPLYLVHWMLRSGFAPLISELERPVYVGLSAGSMALTPRVGDDFVGWQPPGGGDAGLSLVDFSIFPHLDHEQLPENTMADAERWAEALGTPAYALDDRSGLQIVDGEVTVISEGHWRQFPG